MGLRGWHDSGSCDFMFSGVHMGADLVILLVLTPVFEFPADADASPGVVALVIFVVGFSEC